MAGTRLGITALQMDIKISGITPAILEEALAQAKVARFEILDVIESAIAEPRSELAPTAPKIDSIQIPVDKIKVVIGKGVKPLTRLSMRQVSQLISMKKDSFRFSLVIRMLLTVLKQSSLTLYVKLRLARSTPYQLCVLKSSVPLSTSSIRLMP